MKNLLTIAPATALGYSWHIRATSIAQATPPKKPLTLEYMALPNELLWVMICMHVYCAYAEPIILYIVVSLGILGCSVRDAKFHPPLVNLQPHSVKASEYVIAMHHLLDFARISHPDFVIVYHLLMINHLVSMTRLNVPLASPLECPLSSLWWLERMLQVHPLWFFLDQISFWVHWRSICAPTPPSPLPPA